ncbi:MAG: TIGR03032 family protein [Bythopirellula sp.]
MISVETSHQGSPLILEHTLPAKSKSQLRCRASGELAEWLTNSGGSLAITTYTAGKVVLVSSIEGRLHFLTRKFPRPMGMAICGNRIALAARQQVLLFQRNNSPTAAFTLRRKYDTGKVDAHDVAFGERGVYFANTKFNAIARVSPNKRFVHCWQPWFIDGVIRGDRCHLNGLGMRDNRPALATAFCATGQAGGWREQDRFSGGVVLDVQKNTIIADGLCMPHSPRWHNQRWWLCNSGHGLLSTLDSHTGQCTEVCALPGFTRGLCLVDDHALVGLSKIRHKHVLDAPPVRERHKKIVAGVALVDLQSGRMTGKLEFINGGSEVYEVLFLPKIRKPAIRTKLST